MRVALLLAVLTAGCSYQAPTAPTPVPVNPNTPSAINVAAMVGTGTTADHATITAVVLGTTGTELAGVTVTFATTQGSVTPATAVTDQKGSATATLVAQTFAELTVTAGKVTAQREVGTQPPAAPSPTPTPQPTPTPPPTPAPPGPIGTVIINGPTGATTGDTLTFTVSASSDGRPFTWTFGDGGSFGPDPAFKTTHAYASAGTYLVTVNALGAGRSASQKVIISDPPPPPPPPPPPAPSYTVTVTSVPASTLVGVTVTLTAVATPVNGAAPAASYVWDCGNGLGPGAGGTTQGCTYSTTGTFTAKVTASNGTTSGAGSVSVTVAQPAITISCDSPSFGAGPTATVHCSVSASVNGSPIASSLITSTTWDFGDHSAPSTVASNLNTHDYTAALPYTVVVTSTVNGSSATGSTTATVRP